MMNKFILNIILFINLSNYAQTIECVMPIIDNEFSEIYNNNIEKVKAMDFSKKLPLTHVPIQIHRFTTSTGTSNLSIIDIRKEIDSVNKLYSVAGIYFYECYPPKTIAVDNLYDYNTNDEYTVLSTYYTSGCLNLYFPNKITASNVGNVCGYSDYPPGQDYVFIASACAKNGSTLAHEIGHYFGVVHTHDRINGTYEMVNGSNCATAGDKLCDTPADPNLSGKVNSSCVYVGGSVDQNNTLYNPNTALIMSYSLFDCRAVFSPMQSALKYQTLINQRAYLNCTNTSAVTKMDKSTDIQLYPNPANQFLKIKILNATKADIKIYNIQGKEIASYFNIADNETINVNHLQNGYYIFNISVNDEKINKAVVIANY